MAVGIKEIGERLNLFPSTVSRALMDKRALNSKGVPYVSEATVALVLKTAREMGYRPNRAARSLAMGKTMQIAFWVPDMTLRFFHGFACGFHDCLEAAGYKMILCEFPDLTAPPAPTAWLGSSRADVDAAILFGGDLSDDPNWEPAISGSNLDLPMVNIGVVKYDGELDYLEMEAYPASIEAMEHLIATKRNRIVHALCDYTGDTSDPRYRAYADVLKRAGKTPELFSIDSGGSHLENARNSVGQYIKANGPPDAFFCGEDGIAIGISRGLRDLELKIPDDVAIVGFNGIAETEFFDPPISTIALPIDETCAKVWKLLSRRMKQMDLPRQRDSVQAKFQLRGSSQERK